MRKINENEKSERKIERGKVMRRGVEIDGERRLKQNPRERAE